ncbi:protein of unknown function [Cupriavidus taiwanensis]|uniref:Uncharacterized protein n=1 Tax=Cupriavidus taiwanensis TaxID=164546 RepID=A0A9Q7UWD5_9BURK|nr:protein of unknown function [Cupriavidus taiwanensis]
MSDALGGPLSHGRTGLDGASE